MINQNKIHEQIKYFRKKRGLTQEQLAEILDVSIGAVSKWESGQNTPELNMIINLARLFEVSVDVLIGYEVESLDLEENIESINRLTKERKFDEAIELSQRLLFKYPNNFKTVHSSARTYFLAAFDSGDKKKKNLYFEEALQLERKALNLLDQDKSPLLTEIKIKAEISQIYRILGKTDESVRILEEINANDFYSSNIGYILTSQSNPTGKDLEKAYENLQLGLMNSMDILLNTCYGYINYYLKTKPVDYNKILDVCNIARSYCDSLSPNDKKTPSYLDRIKVTFLIVEAISYQFLEDESLADKRLMEIKDMAERYDKSPSFKIESVHLSEKRKSQVFDDFGESLSKSTTRIIKDQLEDDGEADHIKIILEKWEKIIGS
ncbi:MAG: helix-turn-helix transcriptional regulator [Tissierellia bacterium]|nr:helix-turn-helix transcriptional regulator [Tissierellia bacterium]